MAPQPPPPPTPEPRNSGGGRRRPEQGWPRWLPFTIIGVILVVLLATNAFSSDNREEIPYNDFLTAVEQGQVAEAEHNNSSGEIKATLTDGTEVKTTGPVQLTEDVEALMRENIADFKFVTPTDNIFASLLWLLAPFAFLLLIFWWFQRRAQGQMSGIMSIGRSKAKTYSTERPGTTFDDVAGYTGVKQEITEVVDFLKEPERFAQIGARIPKGVLLVGPPGTGKTLLARAVAGEAGVPFLSVTGSDFMEMFVGVGASRVRDLFESARKMGKAIIFIDEIDSIGRKRGAGLGGGHDEREQTLNQMLAEMDGFEATEGIVMMAATNRPDILDPALLRPGRFDRQVVVPLPELEDRIQILQVHAKGKKMADDIDINLIARGTPGMSGADIANLVNEAALIAVREDSDRIQMRHFDDARDRVMIGQKRESMVLTPDEKEAIAYHEAGHALCAIVLPNADPLHKVTIIPSGMALGVTMQLPERERHIYPKEYLEDAIVMRLGGRMAEELVFGMVSSGAADDLARSTDMAMRMVREWGMSEVVGPMAYPQSDQVFLGSSGIGSPREYSEETARIFDQEVAGILESQEVRCRALLTKHRHALDLVARSLLEHETIDGREVERLVELAARDGVDADHLGGRASDGAQPAGGNGAATGGPPAPTPTPAQTPAKASEDTPPPPS